MFSTLRRQSSPPMSTYHCYPSMHTLPSAWATSNRMVTCQAGCFSTSSKDFVARYNGPQISEMTREQKAMRDSIVKNRPRTGLSGPFGPWLAIPSIAQPAIALGKACRYETSLSSKESELVILLTGAYYKSDTEFDIHTSEAILAGLSEDIIEAIPRPRLRHCTTKGGHDCNYDISFMENVKTNVIPLLERNEENAESSREIAIAAFTAELLEQCTVCDATYKTTKDALGGNDSVFVEITSIVGYYAYVCYTLNVFNIPSSPVPSS